MYFSSHKIFTASLLDSRCCGYTGECDWGGPFQSASKEGHSQFLVFIVVLIYSHRPQNEWILNHVPRGNTGLGSCEPVLTTLSLTDQYTTLFYVCFWVNARLMPEQSLPNICVFSVGSTSVLRHFKWQDHRGKAQSCKKCDTEDIMKRTTVYRLRAETRENVTLFSCMLADSNFGCSEHVHKCWWTYLSHGGNKMLSVTLRLRYIW